MTHPLCTGANSNISDKPFGIRTSFCTTYNPGRDTLCHSHAFEFWILHLYISLAMEQLQHVTEAAHAVIVKVTVTESILLRSVYTRLTEPQPSWDVWPRPRCNFRSRWSWAATVPYTRWNSKNMIPLVPSFLLFPRARIFSSQILAPHLAPSSARRRVQGCSLGVPLPVALHGMRPSLGVLSYGPAPGPVLSLRRLSAQQSYWLQRSGVSQSRSPP